jgi:hypothetical protein
MAAAEALKIARGIDDKVEGVDDRVKGVDHKVGSVITGELCRWLLTVLSHLLG